MRHPTTDTRRPDRAMIEVQIGCLIACLTRYGPQRVWLFGSVARGDYHAASDLDLLIVKQTDRPFVERAAEVWRACDADSGVTLPIEPLIYTPSEFERLRAEGNPLIEQALREGRCIYEQPS